MSEPLIHIYADESCLGNQFRDRERPGGAGALLEYPAPGRDWIRRDYWISEGDTTNNRMALISAAELLNLLKRPAPVVFTSDSKYLVDGITNWVHGWARRGWRRKDGEIENLALWRGLVEAARRHRVEWRWVKGHAGHPQNEYANHLATRAARDQTHSEGLVDSSFEEWLAGEQSAGKLLGYRPPSLTSGFAPSRLPPSSP